MVKLKSTKKSFVYFVGFLESNNETTTLMKHSKHSVYKPHWIYPYDLQLDHSDKTSNLVWKWHMIDSHFLIQSHIYYQTTGKKKVLMHRNKGLLNNNKEFHFFIIQVHLIIYVYTYFLPHHRFEVKMKFLEKVAAFSYLRLTNPTID